jgi:hypothetical protein
LDVLHNRGGPDDGGVGDIATWSGHTDTMGIPDYWVLYDRDLIAIRQEGIKVANEDGVTMEEVSYPLDDAGGVDPSLWSVKRELKGSDTHS